ncbi:asparagine synthase (glutamine-hydrolyzing) [Thermomonas fusca]|uniref:asparagine synthase (glutamine-hydrolyzing) n=1 Tax=Thermomonas fusca TaxID=215690 RepID=A0A5R9PCX2_9GAMM|nr:asparagine synthase (glutamine-hydrolyzing) [Thermomonas fusca]TLX21359.1 asparagine synthase (glutamine-hydrolyzing) [Thermomonas fusca]
MCGFSGGLSPGDFRTLHSAARAMTEALAHRGPDDEGLWGDAEAGIVLGHRRLAIVDLSASGHQPMASVSGRWVIVFNGEIYNHLRLREQLEMAKAAPVWHGHSDTETLLAGFEAWGVRATVERCIGMFAFAVWDRQERVLTLGRDRLGEKPLYYGWQGAGEAACFLFGSELVALKRHPAFSAPIDRGALALYMRHNYVPSPYSIHQGIQKLLPGHLLSVSVRKREPVLEPYWSMESVAVEGVADSFQGAEGEAVDALETLLRDAVGQQMMADVPLGAFLSGGIDSSTVVALMQAQSSRPVRTFSIGFDEAGYNEAVHAKAVAAHLGTEHSELYITPSQALEVIPRLPEIYSEPFADSSQIPTYLVSALAKGHVTVALSGDAGDELFGGYNRYVLTRNLWRGVSRFPRPVRGVAAGMLRWPTVNTWNRMARPVRGMLPKTLQMANLGDKVHKAAGVLDSASVDEIYLRLISHWPDGMVLGGDIHPTLLHGKRPALRGLDPLQRMMALDAMTYLPGDILTKVDRAAMAVSLETRVPFLDHRVVEFAWRLPQALKLRDGKGKWILRQVLHRHVPQALIERPKMGFGVPIDAWLRGPLREWAEALLDESMLRQQGYLDPAPIRRRWKEHLSGQRNWQHQLWDVLMFQAWLANEGGSAL